MNVDDVLIGMTLSGLVLAVGHLRAVLDQLGRLAGTRPAGARRERGGAGALRLSSIVRKLDLGRKGFRDGDHRRMDGTRWNRRDHRRIDDKESLESTHL